MVFPAVMYRESWVPKYWCFWTVVLEKTLESPLDCKEIQPVHPRKKSVLNIHSKDWCWSWNSNTLATSFEELTHWKRPWCWEGLRAGGEGMTEDETAGWHHWLDGHESVWTPGVGHGQGSLVCYSLWGCKKSDTTEWTELNTNGCSLLSILCQPHAVFGNFPSVPDIGREQTQPENSPES